MQSLLQLRSAFLDAPVRDRRSVYPLHRTAALGAKRTFGDRCLNRDNFESFARSVLPLHLATETACHVPDPMSAMRGNPENICSH
jgi:hypothetical protein